VEPPENFAVGYAVRGPGVVGKVGLLTPAIRLLVPEARDLLQVLVLSVPWFVKGRIEIAQDAVAKAIIDVSLFRPRGEASAPPMPDGGTGGALAFFSPEE